MTEINMGGQVGILVPMNIHEVSIYLADEHITHISFFLEDSPAK